MSSIRVRFAPSPTGFMHLGNVRAALMNFLFAKQKQGTFILRIEDTDNERNFDEAKQRISEDLAWLGLTYTEGPGVGGDFGPYEQSARHHLYKEKLAELIRINRVYRCFCTPEHLDAKRKEQLTAGKPPRYDRNCLRYPSHAVKQKLEVGMPFIWRFKINDGQALSIDTLNGNTVDFNMEHFSDFAITRSDGSYTFLFVNFVDDWLMKISHVIRGEDHLSNTALQAALYDVFMIDMPVFWHLPIICNNKGEKLSKRDFGFSLTDLRDAGFIPEAITNYLAIMGISISEEVQSLESLSKLIVFEKINLHGGINYDLEKLTWFNQKWLSKLTPSDFITRSMPHVEAHFKKPITLDPRTCQAFGLIQPEARTLLEVPKLLEFYLGSPTFNFETLHQEVSAEKVAAVRSLIAQTPWQEPALNVLDAYKAKAKENGISMKELLVTVRFLLTGSTHGLGVIDLFKLLNSATLQERLQPSAE
jgi:nondiscriminating glutamyl-tRNA synthetase